MRNSETKQNTSLFAKSKPTIVLYRSHLSANIERAKKANGGKLPIQYGDSTLSTAENSNTMAASMEEIQAKQQQYTPPSLPRTCPLPSFSPKESYTPSTF